MLVEPHSNVLSIPSDELKTQIYSSCVQKLQGDFALIRVCAVCDAITKKTKIREVEVDGNWRTLLFLLQPHSWEWKEIPRGVIEYYSVNPLVFGENNKPLPTPPEQQRIPSYLPEAWRKLEKNLQTRITVAVSSCAILAISH